MSTFGMLLASISAEIGGITRAGAMEFLKIYFLIALIGAILLHAPLTVIQFTN